MSIWEDVFEQIIYNELMYSVPDRPVTPDEHKSAPLFNQAILDLFTAGAKDTAVPDLLTTIVNRDEWWVPTNESGKFATIEAEPGQFRKMLEIEQPPSQKKKKKPSSRTGGDGTLLPAYDTQPEGIAATKLDGRQLARQLPKNIDGLLICTREQSDFEIEASHFELMQTLADECDLEDCLTVPGAGQVDTLLNAQWYAEVSQENDARLSTYDKLVLIHTRPDRRGLGFNKRVPMTGQELFSRLVRENVNGALVSITSKIGPGVNETCNLVLSPAVIHALIRGDDIRPGAKPLPAQCLEEIKLWLQFRKFPYKSRRFLDASLDGEKLVRVVVADSSEWRTLEHRSTGVATKPGPTLSPVFSLPSVDESSETSFGPNPSRILCPGMLARELGASAYQIGTNPEKVWLPGRWLVFGRSLSEQDVSDSKRRVALAKEMQKLIPAGADAIPLSAILSFEGMNMYHDNPTAFTRDWIERTLRQAEKYTKSWA